MNPYHLATTETKPSYETRSSILHFTFQSYGHWLFRFHFFCCELLTKIDALSYVYFCFCYLFYPFTFLCVYILLLLARVQGEQTSCTPSRNTIARDPRTIAPCSWAMTLLSQKFCYSERNNTNPLLPFLYVSLTNKTTLIILKITENITLCKQKALEQ